MDGIKLCCKCKVCNKDVMVDNNSVKKSEYKDRSGKSIWCTYFNCPQCGAKHVVQLDDVKTNGILVDITKMMAKIAKLRRQSKSVKKYQRRYNELTEELSNTRNKLAENYDGKLLMNAFGAEEKIEMYVLSHGVDNEKLSGV